MSLDEELRLMLHERAADAPKGSDLLTEVHRLSHRLTVRRRLVALMASLVAVAVVAVAAAWLPLVVRRDLPPAGPAPSISPTPSPLPVGVLPIVLGPANITLPSFPLTPGWEPTGLGRRWVGKRGKEAVLSYAGTQSHLLVAVGAAEYEWEWSPTSQSTTTVGRYPASLRLGTGDVGQTLLGLSWQQTDGRRITIESERIPIPEVVRFAENLQPQELTPTALPFSLALAPQGFVLQRVDDNGLCLGPPDWDYDHTLVGGVCVYVANEHADFTPSTHPIVAGLRGSVTRYAEWHFTIDLLLPDGRLLSVLNSSGPAITDSRFHFSEPDLARFVEGISVTP